MKTKIIPGPREWQAKCAVCGKLCQKRRDGWHCAHCEVNTSVGIEAAEEE